MILEGRTALVTGSGRSIGKATALAFAKEGANVVVNARASQEEVDAVVREAREMGVGALGVLADISAPQQVDRMAQQALDAFGGVDILVNNAAIRPGRPFAELDYDEWRHVLGVDIDGAFLCTKAFLPGMLERRWGRIINVAGMMAYRGNQGYAHISAAKMGLVGLTRSLAVELSPSNILVNCVSPGAINTRAPDPDLTPERQIEAVARRIENIPARRLGTAEEIAGVCVFLAGPAGGYISGQTIHVNCAADRR